MPTNNQKSINVQNLFKSFQVGKQVVPVLKDVNLHADEGEFVMIIGPSGCGKSTLLHTILGLEPPSSGSVEMLGTDIYKLSGEDERSDFRKKHVGMVYQQPNWIKAIDVIENVAFPLALLSENRESRISKAKQMLDSVKMMDWAYYHPAELSSGQQQRVALARALITNPKLIIADEPTGNLDVESGEELMGLLRKLNKESKKTILMVTHNLNHLSYSDREISLLDGRVQDSIITRKIKNIK
jgi:putative ABC transport system ATP-binding protein